VVVRAKAVLNPPVKGSRRRATSDTPTDPTPDSPPITLAEALASLDTASPTSPSSSSAQTTDGLPFPVLEENDTRYCAECFLPLHADPAPEELYIYLHAVKYETSLGVFEAPLPEWAEEGWAGDGGAVVS
jgi:tRNA pseudouridine synthase 9